MKRLAALILAAVFLLSLAACSNGAAEWAQELKAEDIDSAMAWSWDGENDVQNYLGEEETAELVSLLNKLPDDAFTENTENAGITPSFGILIEIDGKYCKLNEADAPSGSLQLSRGDTQWWIDNDELTSFVKSVCRVAE